MIYTDAEINEFIKMFGDRLPNPVQSPKQFDFYVRMFKFLNAPKTDAIITTEQK